MSNSGLAWTFVDIALLVFGVGGVGSLFVALLRGKGVVGIVCALLVACFFLTIVTALFHWASWTSDPSVFVAFGSPYKTAPGWQALTYFAALGVVGQLVAYLLMRAGRRVADG